MTQQPKIKINVWLTDPASWATNEADIAVSAASEFNEAHPEYQVEINRHDFRTMPAEVARAAEHGETPDIAEYHFTATRAAMDMLGPDGNPCSRPSGEPSRGGPRSSVSASCSTTWCPRRATTSATRAS